MLAQTSFSLNYACPLSLPLHLSPCHTHKVWERILNYVGVNGRLEKKTKKQGELESGHDETGIDEKAKTSPWLNTRCVKLRHEKTTMTELHRMSQRRDVQFLSCQDDNDRKQEQQKGFQNIGWILLTRELQLLSHCYWSMLSTLGSLMVITLCCGTPQHIIIISRKPTKSVGEIWLHKVFVSVI